MTNHRIRFAAILLLVVSFPATSLNATPSHTSPDKSLQVHGSAACSNALGVAETQYAEVAQKLIKFLEYQRTNSPTKLDADELGKLHLNVTVMRRAATFLISMGEPAGFDYELRGKAMHTALLNLIDITKPLPQGQKYILAARAFVMKNRLAREKVLRNIEALCREKKWAAAETMLYSFSDAHEPWTLFLSSEEGREVYPPFTIVTETILAAMTEIRTAASTLELTKAIQDTTPKYEALMAEINTAIDTYLSSGAGTWRTESVTGPQLVSKIGQTWSETQVLAHQNRGKIWAINFRSGLAGPNSIENIITIEQATANFDQFSQGVRIALAKLVAADGARATNADARNLYLDYLRALAPLNRQVAHAHQPQFADSLQQSLKSFLGKSPALDQEMNGYSSATSDLLRWRARVAQALAAKRAAEFAPITQRFHEGTVSAPNFVGLFPEPGNSQSEPQLLSHVPDIMPVAVKRLLNQKTTVRDVLRMPGESKSAIARYTGRTYANVPAPLNIAGEVSALKSDLMVSDQSPPMSLAAMQAVLTAERGDMSAVGGVIVGTYLEGVVTRFATLRPTAAILTPLGQLPTEKFDGIPLANMLMRFDISPRWAEHDYFFVNLAPSSNTPVQ